MAIRFEGDIRFDRPGGIKRLQEKFGPRPGNYRVDPYYFRAGIGHKPYYWDDYERKWKLLKFGMEFDLDENGIMVRVDNDD